MGVDRAEVPAVYVRAGGLMPGLVASAVGYRTDHAGPALHRGLPSPYLTFLFSLSGPVVCGRTPDHARGRDPFRNLVLVGGLHLTPAYVLPDDHQVGIQLAVHPLAARDLFGAPARELAALVIDGPDILGAEAEGIRARMGEAPSWAMSFVVLQDYLRSRVDRQPRQQEAVRPEVAEAWRWLAWRRGTGSLDDVAAHVSLGARQLRTLFQREVGRSPKQVNRLLRFQHATHRIAYAVADGQPPDLAGIAARCGYFDHAHLDRDFIQFAGISPSGWVAEERRNIQDGGHRSGEQWSHE